MQANAGEAAQFYPNTTTPQYMDSISNYRCVAHALKSAGLCLKVMQ